MFYCVFCDKDRSDRAATPFRCLCGERLLFLPELQLSDTDLEKRLRSIKRLYDSQGIESVLEYCVAPDGQPLDVDRTDGNSEEMHQRRLRAKNDNPLHQPAAEPGIDNARRRTRPKVLALTALSILLLLVLVPYFFSWGPWDTETRCKEAVNSYFDQYYVNPSPGVPEAYSLQRSFYSATTKRCRAEVSHRTELYSLGFGGFSVTSTVLDPLAFKKNPQFHRREEVYFASKFYSRSESGEGYFRYYIQKPGSNNTDSLGLTEVTESEYAQFIGEQFK